MDIRSTLFNKTLCLVFVLCIALTGCASQTGNTFSSSQTRSANTVLFGTITHLADAFIENDPSGAGALGGAVVGGVAGSTLGGGRGRVLTTLGGAIIGGLVGTGIEKSVRSRDALEITVQLESGQALSIVQELGAEERSFAVGDRVRVLRSSDGSARVRR